MKKLFLIFGTIFIISCCDKKSLNDDKEVLFTCVVDSVWVKKPNSSIEYDIVFYYKTDCGNVLTTRQKMIYSKGDTITYLK